ncbi:hypothetical protein NRY95_17860 [Xanthomonas campestris pv. phormiicola]|nr:hypothetical protein [Xanthomonas campestris pv. phormiicola]UYC15551.1 hypothetical protein NRY95_17860 [Xanthomonas campestris pv. phormiicola]
MQGANAVDTPIERLRFLRDVARGRGDLWNDRLNVLLRCCVVAGVRFATATASRIAVPTEGRKSGQEGWGVEERLRERSEETPDLAA